MSNLLFFDIETTPLISYTWDTWQTDVIRVKEEWHILCFSYKWLGGRVKSHALPDYPLYKRDKDSDKELVKDLWKLFNEADIICGHNSQSFDVKKSQARFTFYNLPPPKPFEQIDTKLVAKRYFKFTSNRLNDLALYLGLGQKVHTGGFDLWLNCMKGDPKAWRKMVRYNKGDVTLLNRVYLHLRPWIKNHPYQGGKCANCGSSILIKRGFNRTKNGLYQRFQCDSCYAWSKKKIK